MNISRGYIRLFRQMDEWEWYDKPFVKVIFLHCLLKANDKAKQWQNLTLKRGQFVTSVEKLAIANGLTTQQTRTALKSLQLTNEITIETTSRYSIITVKNYNLYQVVDRGEQQTNNKQITNKLTNPVTTTNKIREIIINNNLSLEEREILKNYLIETSKRKIDDIDAYMRKLIENGDYSMKLEKALKRLERQKKKEVIPPPDDVEQESAEDTKKAFEECQEQVKKIKRLRG